jgi:hypothetical protein
MNQHDRRRPHGNPYRGGRDFRGPDLLTSVADAARENPLSTALIGFGALWLYTGGSNMSLLGGRGRTSVIGSAARGAGDVAAGTAHMASGAAHGVAHAARTLASGARSAASSLAESVSEGATEVKNYVTGAAHGVDAQSEYRNPDIAEQERGGWRRSDGDRNRGSKAQGFRESMADMFERHPLALGLVGIAAGMGIAASLPMTGKERQTLGKARDAVGGKLAEATEQAKEFAGTVVKEAKQQGLGRTE